MLVRVSQACVGKKSLCVAAKRCAGAGASLLWGGGVGKCFGFVFFLHRFLNCFSACLTSGLIDAAAVHPEDGSSCRP